MGWVADFVVAALGVLHDPPGFPAVQFLLASLVGQRVADDPGEQERQRRPGQHQHPEYPGDRVEGDVQVVGDLVVGCRGPQQPVQRDAGQADRGAVGVAGVTLYGLLWAAAANDQIDYHLHIPLYTVTWILRVLVLAGPTLAFLLTRVICHALAGQRRDEELHGPETGRIVQNPHGGYEEIREPARRAAPPTANPPGPATTRQILEGGPMSWTGRA